MMCPKCYKETCQCTSAITYSKVLDGSEVKYVSEKLLKDVIAECKAIKEENYLLREQNKIMREALVKCANRPHCRAYECCGGCGPMYEAEDALEKCEEVGK